MKALRRSHMPRRLLLQQLWLRLRPMRRPSRRTWRLREFLLLLLLLLIDQLLMMMQQQKFFFLCTVLVGVTIPHFVQVLPQLQGSPGVNLTVQRSSSALLRPPPDVLFVGQLSAIQQVLLLQPSQRAQPSDLTDRNVNEPSPPSVEAEPSLNSGCRKVTGT